MNQKCTMRGGLGNSERPCNNDAERKITREDKALQFFCRHHYEEFKATKEIFGKGKPLVSIREKDGSWSKPKPI